MHSSNWAFTFLMSLLHALYKESLYVQIYIIFTPFSLYYSSLIGFAFKLKFNGQDVFWKELNSWVKIYIKEAPKSSAWFIVDYNFIVQIPLWVMQQASISLVKLQRSKCSCFKAQGSQLLLPFVKSFSHDSNKPHYHYQKLSNQFVLNQLLKKLKSKNIFWPSRMHNKYYWYSC